MKIYIGNDHGGYKLKKAIMNHLLKQRHSVINVGSDSEDIVRYPYYAAEVATAVSSGEAEKGILICNSGIGMSIVANKYNGVRAALVDNKTIAALTREHNDSNVLCLGSKFTDVGQALEIVDLWLSTDFEGGRHNISIDLIKEIEKTNFTKDNWNLEDTEAHQNIDDYYKRPVKKPVKILLDTDMLTDCDDVAAIAMLHSIAKKGDAEILAITVSSRYQKSAPVVQAVNTFYNRSDIPVGAPKNGTGAYRDDSCFLDKVSSEFETSLNNNDDAEDAVRVMRKALVGINDKSVVIVTIGYMCNLAGLIKSGPDDISDLTGKQLIENAVDQWVCMAGNFPDDPAFDNVNFTRDAEPALYAVRNFPGRITFVGRDIGHNIFIGDKFKQLADENPLRRSYQLHRGRYGDNWDHHTADPSTVLYAVYGLADYFNVQHGTMILHDDCSFQWDPNKKSNMSYILQRMDRKQMAKVMEDLIMEG